MPEQQNKQEQLKQLAEAVKSKDGSRLNWVNIAVFIVALLYGVSPLDIIPDVLFPMGFADDGVVALISLLFFIFNKGKKRA